jgi:hypothetical protein
VKLAVVGGLMAAAGGGIYLVASTQDGAEEREQVVAETPTPTDVERLNAKLESLGEPTIPPDWDLRTPFAYPTRPGDDERLAALGTPTPWVPSCGPQEGPGGAQDINDRYGDVRTDCHLYLDTKWVVTLNGRPGEVGAIGVLSCVAGDDECLAGGEPTIPATWQIYPLPCAGSARILAYHPPDILLMNGGICFDIRTESYNLDRSCGRLPIPDPATDTPTPVSVGQSPAPDT